MGKSLYFATGNRGYLLEHGIPIPDNVDVSLAKGLVMIRKVRNKQIISLILINKIFSCVE